MRRLVLALVAWLAFASPGAAQARTRLTVGVDAQSARLVREQAPDIALNGIVAAMQAGVAIGRVGLEIGYAQGRLSPDADAANAEELVDGEAMLAVRALPWLVLRGGPHLRAWVTPAGTQRWMRVEGRAEVSGEVIPGRVRAHAEVWSALSTDVNLGVGASGARGGRVGLTMAIANSPLLLRLMYTADRAELADGRADVLEGIGLGLVWRRQ